ncbi:MAG: multi-sensor signal transduction histidine kinase [Myxococcales bacterium]|nr:multi-sensor signal transduction histidine kinase [Myxococcales bacterium]
MLAELLEELTPQLVRRVNARIADSPSPELAPARCPAERTSALLHELVAALRRQRVDLAPCDMHFAIGVDVEPLLSTVRLLKECVYDEIDERGLAVPPRELRLIGDWFAELSEKSLREQNRRLVAMLDALPDQLLLQDVDGRFIFLNRAAAEMATAMTGLSRKELIGRAFLDIELPDGFKQYIRAVTARVQKGESVKEEFLLPGPNGGRWREHHLAPVTDAQGKVEAIAIANRDIHARKVAEERLQLLSKVGTLAATTEYEGVLTGVARLSIPELADWCIIDVVEDGRVRRGKVAHRDPAKVALAEEILQFSPERSDLSIGRDVLSGGLFLVGELDDAGMRERDPKFYDVIHRLGASSVMIIPFVVLGAPIAVATFVFTPESGRRHGPEDLALAQEMARRAAQIIENARLHERLRRSEARFRVALERSNIAVFEVDTDFRIRWMYNAQLGDKASAIDKTVGDFLPFDASADLDAIKRRVLQTGEGARTAVDAVVGGERRHLLVNYEPLREVGGIIGLTGTAVDITDAKKIQEELAQALAFRERVMGILSHDLRNPLSSVLGLAGLLRQQETLSENAKEGLRRIERSAERMNEMIGTILDFTNLRFRGAPRLSVEAVQLDVLARTIVDELRVAHPGRTIEIDAQGDLRGRWDGGRIAQVVSNLVGNALTHGARESPVQLSLSAEDGSVFLSVTNRGPTIPEEFVDQLFEPFRQGPDDGDALRPRGLGLGLFIVRQIVIAHGGEVDVRSRDQVTTFTVHLPRVAAS